jgi:WD40 repeat protein
MAEPETMIIRAHDGPAKPVRFSPDGKLVGTCGDDGAVRLWDPATGALVRTFEGEKGHGKTSFDLDPRGGRIVVTGPAGTVECYELATGRRLRRSGPLPAPARTLVFSPDGKRLAVGHETPPHTLLDADTLEVRSTIGTRLSHERRTTIPEQEVARGNFVFNHAGDRIGHNITTTPNQMRIAESASDRTILTLPYILYDINPIFTADDRQLVVSGETGVRLIDSATGSTLHIFEESRNGAFSVINRQGDTLATVSWSGERQVTATANRFKLWHLPSRRELRSIPTKEADIIRSMAFSPDGQTLAAATFRGRLFFWFHLSGRKPATLQVAGGRASGLVVSPSGAIVAVGGHDGSVGLVELTPTPRHRGLSGPGPAVFGISVNPDGRTVASACADGHVRVRDAKDGGLVRDLTLGPGQVLAVAFDPSGKRLAAAGDDRKLVVWDLASGNTELSVADAHDAPVLGLAYSPDGRMLATCGGDRAVRIRDARTGRVLRSLSRTVGTEEEEPFSRLTFSPDGRQLVGASTDGTAVVWDVGGWSSSSTPRLTLTGHTGAVHDAGFSPDGRRVITAGADGTVRLWDPVIGVETLELRAGAPVASAAFAPDGLRILAAGWDGVVTVWDARPVTWVPGRGAVYGPR